MKLLLVIFGIVTFAFIAESKVFERCELARELKNKYHMPSELSTWVCLAYHESRFRTDAINTHNRDHSIDNGLFQINNRYWCDQGSRGCGVSCAELRTDDITKQVNCAKTVFHETVKLGRNGFSAWAAYAPHCRGNTKSYIQGCFKVDEYDDEPEKSGFLSFMNSICTSYLISLSGKEDILGDL